MIRAKFATAVAAILLCGAAQADVPAPAAAAGDTTVQAVMFEWAFDASGNIRHAQVIAGYPTMDACVNAMRTVMGRAVVVEGADNLTPQLLCQGIKTAPAPTPKLPAGTTSL